MVLPAAMLLLGEVSWWPSRPGPRATAAAEKRPSSRPAVDVR
jgi:RND superfamily putative drug exporter